MADATPNVLDALGAVAGKLGPGILGSLIALRWLPESTTRLDRLIAVVGGIASSAYFGQAIAELAGVNSQGLANGIAFACGLFGMAFVGETMQAIKEVGLGQIVGDGLRQIFRIKRS